MMKSFVVLLIISFSFLLPAKAQRIKLLSGDPAVLKGETKLNVVFTYEGMRVGKFDKEEDYIENKKSEYNKKEEGRGERWEASWKADRAARYEPNFIDLFMKHSPFALGKYKDAKYTLIINTVRTEPGYNIYITRKNAEIDLEIRIVETATQQVIAEYTVFRAPGRTFGGYDYDTGVRIEEAYATAGKYFAKELKGDVD